MSACPEPFALDRFGAAVLPDPGGEVARHVAGCDRCRQALDDTRAAFAPLWRDRARILEAIEARRRPAWRRRAERLLPVPAALAAAAALLLSLRPAADPAGDTLVAKGQAPRLEVFRERGGAVARVVADDVLREGDRLVFRVHAPGPREVMVVGIEASGAPFTYAASAGRSLPVGEGRTELPVGALLDASTGDEAIVLVACEAPFDLARALAPGEGCERETLRVRKEAR